MAGGHAQMPPARVSRHFGLSPEVPATARRGVYFVGSGSPSMTHGHSACVVFLAAFFTIRIFMIVVSSNKRVDMYRQVLEGYFLGSGSPSMTHGHSLCVDFLAPFFTIRIFMVVSSQKNERVVVHSEPAA
jgi:hypothetical protein